MQIGGCNDCHTPGYVQTDGKVDEKLWLTGTALGWRGPWGTTYPPNLRVAVQKVISVFSVLCVVEDLGVRPRV